MGSSKQQPVPGGAGLSGSESSLKREADGYLTLLQRLKAEVNNERLAARLMREIAKDKRMQKVNADRKAEQTDSRSASYDQGAPQDTVEVKQFSEEEIEKLIGQVEGPDRRPSAMSLTADVGRPFEWNRRDRYVRRVEYPSYEEVTPENVAREYRGVV